LTGKTHLQNDVLCVDGDAKPCLLTQLLMEWHTLLLSIIVVIVD